MGSRYISTAPEYYHCGHGARQHAQPHSFILSYGDRYTDEVKYILLVEDDNNETFKLQQQELAPAVVSPLIKQFSISKFVGACHGLVCLFCYNESYNKDMVVIWNPSIRKSFGTAVVSNDDYNLFGFGVRPDTSDPTVVKIIQTDNKPWNVEVFTLSSYRFIYWDAYDTTFAYDPYMLVSFDLITKEFKLVHLPDSLTYKQRVPVSHDSSFKKLFSIGAPFKQILGFKESGEPIIETSTNFLFFTTLDVYDPSSQLINNLGISGASGTFGMGSYKKLLLLVPCEDRYDVSLPTRWVKSVPIKVNIIAWKVKSNALPTRFNISRRGMDIDSIVCPICNAGVESTNHIFFQCVVVRQIMRKISSWWNIDYSDVNSYEEWRVWLVSIRIQSKLKGVLEGVYYGLWWYMWNFRNKLLFDKKIPEKALVFNNLVSSSFYWCKFRCKASFKWDDWLKNPYIVLV
ncbi:RNA-directed DNA polymerase, eukaryota [Tanacetum coccineum]